MKPYKELEDEFAKRFKETLEYEVDQQEVPIAFHQGDLVIDYSNFKAYWRRLRKNLDAVLAGHINYKKQEKKDFKLCGLESNIYEVFTDCFPEKLMTLEG